MSNTTHEDMLCSHTDEFLTKEGAVYRGAHFLLRVADGLPSELVVISSERLTRKEQVCG